MKRVIYAAFILLSLGAFCASCSKEDNGSKLDDRLVGTKWQCEDSAYKLIYGGTCYEVYEFVSTTEVERYTTRNGVVASSDGSFTYSLNYPSIVINVVDSKGVKTPTSYTFTDSRTMVRDGTEGKGFYSKYLKQ